MQSLNSKYAFNLNSVARNTTSCFALLVAVVLTAASTAQAGLIDGDFGTGGAVTITNNNSYTVTSAGSWGTNSGQAWDIDTTDGNPADSALWKLLTGNEVQRFLTQAYQDSSSLLGDGQLSFDINYQDFGSDLLFEYQVYGWDGVGTFVNNSTSIPASAQVLLNDSINVAGNTSGGWISHLDTNINFGTGYDYLVVRFSGEFAGGDLLAVDNVVLTTSPVVPEPSSLLLLSFGLLGMVRHARRRRVARVSK